MIVSTSLLLPKPGPLTCGDDTGIMTKLVGMTSCGDNHITRQLLTYWGSSLLKLWLISISHGTIDDGTHTYTLTITATTALGALLQIAHNYSTYVH